MSEADAAEYPKTVVLKDGAHLVLRLLRPDEREPVARLVAAFPFDPRGPARLDTAEVVVVAFDGERLAGAAALARRRVGTAAVAVVLDPAYRGRRLGTWMLLDAVHLAGGLGLSRLEAHVAADDGEQLAALRRLDFLLDPAESSSTRCVLGKTLHRAWTDF